MVTTATPNAQTQAEALELLEQAIAIKSEPEIGINEGEITEFYATQMRDIGMEVDIFEGAPDRPNIVGILRGTGSGKSILFNSHSMYPASRLEDWNTDPYKLVVHDGNMYGMGVCDTKAGIVAMLQAARMLAADRGRGDLIIGLGAGGEGGGFIGTRAIVQRGVRADLAVVCEPTELDIVHVQYGAVWVELTVRGKAGFTGAGLNAVRKATPVVDALWDMNETINSRTHPLLPPSKISVNAIHGGDQFYNVPDRCVIRADRRIVPGETPEGALAELEALAQGLRERDPELDLSIDVKLQLPPIETQPDSLVVRELSTALEHVRGAPPRLKGIRGFTEMAHIDEVGIEAVVCGPGSTSVIHAPNEYVPLQEFLDTISVYGALTRRITSLPSEAS